MIDEENKAKAAMILETAANWIEQHGLNQNGAYYGSAGAYTPRQAIEADCSACPIGAMRIASTIHSNPEIRYYHDGAYHLAFEHLDKEVRAIPSGRMRAQGWPIHVWSDNFEGEVTELTAVLRRVAGTLKEEPCT